MQIEIYKQKIAEIEVTTVDTNRQFASCAALLYQQNKTKQNKTRRDEK